ncbi:hypothetical protein ABGB18_38660 [Nonomuraea sp. B12E4]|uniref:hypothetical protein n=1 Tax=Nonomuraea sp. B12E4 TaxID=3153564 RepID=UPI00325EF547
MDRSKTGVTGLRRASAALAGFAAMFAGFVAAAPAHADPAPPKDSIVMSDSPPPGEAVPFGTWCGGHAAMAREQFEVRLERRKGAPYNPLPALRSAGT